MKDLFIGIDFSKEKVDVAVITATITATGLSETAQRNYNEFKNSISGFRQPVKWVGQNSDVIAPSSWFFCG